MCHNKNEKIRGLLKVKGLRFETDLQLQDDPILSWLKAFLTDRSQYVILNNMKSYATSVLSGVPQGSFTVSNIYK